MSDATEYSKAEVDKILKAYRQLFPRVGAELEKYWDYAGKRQWSCLTTDFRKTNYDILRRLGDEARAVLLDDPIATGNELTNISRKLSSGCGRVGYSIGISPWTDDFLLRTHVAGRNRLFIVMGQDWYPIVTERGYRPEAPLTRDSLDLGLVKKSNLRYAKAIPHGIDATILFLNLNPDFRPPLDSTTGPTVEDWMVSGIDALFADLSEEFEIIGMFSWGSAVWDALRGRLDSTQNGGIMEVGKLHEGRKPLRCVRLGSGAIRSIPYWAFAHPSYPPYFNKHRSAFDNACDGFGVRRRVA